MKKGEQFEQYDETRYLYSPTRRDLAFTVERLRHERVGSPGHGGIAVLSNGQNDKMAPLRWKARCSEGAVTERQGERRVGLRLQDLRLAFSVSRDEEYVHLQATGCGSTLDLGARAHNYLLLTLARHRVADQADDPSGLGGGWVYQDDLAHDCTMAAPRLNVDVFRIRQHFADRGVLDANNIVERRAQTRQLRIGTARISIVCI
jgi:hypothetical protein